MPIDLAFPMVLRNDAVPVHRNAVRRDFAISEDTYDRYALAGLTRGEEKLWAKFSALGEGKLRYDLLQKLTSRQPALRLGLLLDDLAEAALLAGVADLRTREGAYLCWNGWMTGLLPYCCRHRLRARSGQN